MVKGRGPAEQRGWPNPEKERQNSADPSMHQRGGFVGNVERGLFWSLKGEIQAIDKEE